MCSNVYFDVVVIRKVFDFSFKNEQNKIRRRRDSKHIMFCKETKLASTLTGLFFARLNFASSKIREWAFSKISRGFNFAKGKNLKKIYFGHLYDFLETWQFC